VSIDKALAQALAAPPAPVYLITGGAGLLVQRATDAIVERILPTVGPRSFNVLTLHASDPGSDEAIGMARTPPMMADRRLVVVRAIETAKDPFFEALDRYLDSVNPDTSLLLCGAGFPPVVKGGKNWSARLGKKLSAAGITLTYSTENLRPIEFAMETAESLGNPLSRPDAQLLVAVVGPDLGRLVCEIEKASLYVEPGAPLDAATITIACSAVAEQDVWGLTGALARADRSAALGALHRLLADGDSAHRLLGLIVWQMRVMLRVREILARGGSFSDAVNEARGRSELVRAVQVAMQKGSLTAAPVMARLARAHRGMNGMKAGEDRVLESLVLELTNPA
jgi:DNA polymerase-3 subunit delta